MKDEDSKTDTLNKKPDTGSIEAETAIPEPSLVRKRLKDIKDIFAALTHRDYRYFWAGAFLSSIGTWLQLVALGWLVYQISDSAFILGLVNFAMLGPIFFFSIPAGVAADRYDRRQLIIWTQVVMMAAAFILGAFTTLKIASIPAIIIINLVGGVALAFNFPPWQAIVPDLVPRKDLLNAIALNSAQFNTARLVGPAIAGIMLANWGAASCFYLNGISYITVIIALLIIRPHPNPRKVREKGQTMFAYITSGVKYAKDNLVVGILLLSTALITLFTTAYIALMPIFAKDILKVGAQGYGALLAAGGLGAAIGALIVSYLTRILRNQMIIKGGTIVLSLLLIAFAYSHSFTLSLILLAGVGASFLATLSTINTSIQTIVPNEIRGRIMSLYVLAFLGLMPFSSLIFGWVAQIINAPISIIIGAGSCLLIGLVLIFRPALLKEVP